MSSSSSLTLALDAMGGDNAPRAVVEGAALALSREPGLSFIFFGDSAQIEPILSAHPALARVSRIENTETQVESCEKPSAALRKKETSSMGRAIAAVRDGVASGVVSGGNTGALMAMAMFILRRLPGIDRPAIASVFPTMGRDTVVLDLGANTACDAENLVQFAVLGAVFSKIVRGVDTPDVGLLNVGTEDMKGREEIRAAAAILKNVPFPGRFSGHVEGNDIPKGSVDVVVTDGFTGNVALKLAEGMGRFSSHVLREALGSSWLAKAGALLAWPALRALKVRLDPRLYNGGPFLGVDGVCVKSHGGSDALGFSCAILVAAHMVENGFNARVAEEIRNLSESESALKSRDVQSLLSSSQTRPLP
ncbi:MAG: phosphate acyltransferase PlsX [Rhodospirillales bacterium]|nr:phosphate acyltransferase PlsX [Rhodospirillales bacterium]